MLQVARLSPDMLGDSTQLVADFLVSQQHDDGGFCDRAGRSDIYYTTFGIAGLTALQMPLPIKDLTHYLDRWMPRIAKLSLVELSCLARCWAGLPAEVRPSDLASQVMAKLLGFRTDDGGYGTEAGDSVGTLYGCFLALSTAQDVGELLPDAGEMIRCIRSLKSADGGYANSRELPFGLVPATAAASALLRHLGGERDPEIQPWLLSCLHPEGGFVVGPGIPMPDLLSTAVALHALNDTHCDIEPMKEHCLDYLDTLWTARGGFFGTWEDDALDLEYTYYGLLSLGHLSL
jgi:prenyltransferase beta subunit